MERKVLARYSLEHEHRRLEVEIGTAGAANEARLLVDGHQVDRRQVWRVGVARLTSPDATVSVSWWWTGRVGTCALVEKNEQGPGKRAHTTLFEPPAGTRGHRLWRMQQERPGLYAARHVAIALVQVGIAVLGIGALLAALLPHVDLSWIPWPDLHLSKPSWWPDVSLWGWLTIDLPEISPPDWVRDVARTAKFWVPVLVAIAVARNEYERRTARAAKPTDTGQEPAKPTDTQEDTSADTAPDAETPGSRT